MSPFRIPTAINFEGKQRTACILCNTCDGFPCKIEAKNDAIISFLNRCDPKCLHLKPNSIVNRVLREGEKITGVEVLDAETSEKRVFTAKIYVLSAGAIQSPAILMRSGLSGPLLGRNLMRHANAFVSYVFPFVTNPESVFHKQVCVTDFYEHFREQYGTSGGCLQENCMPAAEIIKYFAPRGLKNIASFLSSYIQGLLVIAEDDPRLENRVVLSESVRDCFDMPVIKVDHSYSVQDIERRDFLVQKARKILRKAGGLFSNVFEIDTFSHAVGTLRFGKEPATSVLDQNCRLWGLSNLYVLDGSFMPTSAGLNPSLTIAANSLRVGEWLKSHWTTL